MKLDESLLSAFHIPIVRLSDDYHFLSCNEAFAAVIDLSEPLRLTDISSDFNERRFLRKMAQDQSYSCRLISNGERPRHFWLEMIADGTGYLGFLTDASAIAKADAMMASYSDLIEKQNREIKRQSDQLAIWSKRIKQELEQAETVQDLLVPALIKQAGIESRCLPLRELSGDFHEAITDADGTVTFISGDVAGKGIYAAILLAQMLTAFRAYHQMPELPLVASHIVDALDGKFPDGLFVALTLVRLSANRQTAQLLNLGNPDALLITASGIAQTLPAKGPAIGILPAMFYETLTADHLHLNEAALYVFSDGIIDFNLGDDKSFADANEANAFLASLENNHGEQALDQLMTMAKQRKQDDDIMIARFTSERSSS